MDPNTQRMMMGAAGGAPAADWSGLVRGDAYQGGRIYKPASNKYQLWYYPESRKSQSSASARMGFSPTAFSGSFEVRDQTNLNIYLVGGGAGGTGENGRAGSGGAGIKIINIIPVNLETFVFTVGVGGRGGVYSTSSTANGLGNNNNNQSEPGGDTTLSGTGLNVQAGGGTRDNFQNPPNYINGASTTVTTNTRGTLNQSNVNSGRGGSRYLAGENGANGGAGGGGGNNYAIGGATAANNDRGGNGSGIFGGGGGGGNGYDYLAHPPGGTGSNFGFNGGRGGSAQYNLFGDDGGCPIDNSSAYPNFKAGGGISYRAIDGTQLSLNFARGSAGGGGFPGGGGGSSYYGTGSGNMGIGGDGASGICVFEWTE